MSFFGRKAIVGAGGNLPAGAMQRAAGLANWSQGRPYVPRGARNVDVLVRDTYERVTAVFAAVNAKSRNWAKLDTIVRRDSAEDGPLIPDHPLLPLLNFRASRWTRESGRVFRWRLMGQVQLSSRGAFVEVIRSNGGDVLALHLLPPQTVTPIPSADPQRLIEAYEVRPPNGEKYTVPADEMLWIRYPHPLDPWRSFTPAEAAGLAVDTDFYAHLYNAQFLKNDGRPGGVVVVNGLVNAQDMDELHGRFNRGAWSAGEWRVYEGNEGGIQAVDLAVTPREAAYLESVNATKTEILTAFGVPESVAGNASGRTYDNAAQEKETFWLETMQSDLMLINGAFDQLDDDPTTFVTHDFSKVPALQRAAADRRAEMRSEMQVAARTIDEYRRDAGEDLDPFDEPETRVPYQSMGESAVFLDPVLKAQREAEAQARADAAAAAPVPPPATGNGNGAGDAPVVPANLAPATA